MWKKALVVVATAVTVAGCGPARLNPSVEPVSPPVVEVTSAPPSDPPASPTAVPSITQAPATQPPAAPTTPTGHAAPTTPTGHAADSGAAQGDTAGSGSSGGDAGSCGQDYYRNSDGVCVHRPASGAGAPAGATARCSDGTYSYSTHRSGTCSHHGGVAVWY